MSKIILLNWEKIPEESFLNPANVNRKTAGKNM